MRTYAWLVLIGISLVLAGCVQTQAQADATPAQAPANAQKISLRALNTGLYDKSEIRVKAGQPVEFSFSADPDSACGREVLIPAFGVKLLSLNGETKKAVFTPTTLGTFDYHCSMRMFRGKLIIE